MIIEKGDNLMNGYIPGMRIQILKISPGYDLFESDSGNNQWILQIGVKLELSTHDLPKRKNNERPQTWLPATTSLHAAQCLGSQPDQLLDGYLQ